jgi:hypothetical protein
LAAPAVVIGEIVGKLKVLHAHFVPAAMIPQRPLGSTILDDPAARLRKKLGFADESGNN